ncbi:hypothetical protein CEXT_31521 [Caerostris extrusa]|uniref:Uncharacterized protein n=1 Tax=Caerostris extrusa TaxID=172846 RepID=A0AAV4UEY0_CAEEX|nr:hypothetical protein CEXT_31521 [Caerostris extrusa]
MVLYGQIFNFRKDSAFAHTETMSVPKTRTIQIDPCPKEGIAYGKRQGASHHQDECRVALQTITRRETLQKKQRKKKSFPLANNSRLPSSDNGFMRYDSNL